MDPSAAAWHRVLTYLNHCSHTVRNKAGLYFAKRYDVATWQRNRLAFQTILSSRLADLEDNRGTYVFHRYVETVPEKYEKYSLTEPLLWLADREARGEHLDFRHHGESTVGHLYRATVDPLACVCFELTPVNTIVPPPDNFTETCEALLHVVYAKELERTLSEKPT